MEPRLKQSQQYYYLTVLLPLAVSKAIKQNNFPLGSDFQRTWTRTVGVSRRHVLIGIGNKMFSLFII